MKKQERDKLWGNALKTKREFCEACYDRDTTLHIHHICHRDRLNWDRPWNLITLCAGCHTKVHTKGKKTFTKEFPFLSLRFENSMIQNNQLEVK